MPKDYARKPSARPVKPAPVKQRSSFSVFVMGAVFGAVLMHFTPVLLQKSPSPAAAVKEVGETIKAEASDLKFDFYTILKNSEIVVPSGGTEPGASAQPSDNATYLLQAGSFRLSSQDESLREEHLSVQDSYCRIVLPSHRLWLPQIPVLGKLRVRSLSFSPQNSLRTSISPLRRFSIK